jgi:hypothetical protein
MSFCSVVDMLLVSHIDIHVNIYWCFPPTIAINIYVLIVFCYSPLSILRNLKLKVD